MAVTATANRAARTELPERLAALCCKGLSVQKPPPGGFFHGHVASWPAPCPPSVAVIVQMVGVWHMGMCMRDGPVLMPVAVLALGHHGMGVEVVPVVV